MMDQRRSKIFFMLVILVKREKYASICKSKEMLVTAISNTYNPFIKICSLTIRHLLIPKNKFIFDPK